MKVLSTFSSAMILNVTTSLKNIETLGRKTVFLHQMDVRNARMDVFHLLHAEMHAVAKMLNLAILAGENVNEITKGILVSRNVDESGEGDKY